MRSAAGVEYPLNQKGRPLSPMAMRFADRLAIRVLLTSGALIVPSIFVIVLAECDNMLPISVIYSTIVAMVVLFSLSRLKRMYAQHFLPPVCQFFILSLFFFYVMRGWAFLFLQDSDFMLELGVIDVNGKAAEALGWVSLFLACLLAGYTWGLKRFVGGRLFGKTFIKVFCRKPLLPLRGLAMAGSGLAAATLCAAYMYLEQGPLNRNSVDTAWGNYALLAPYALYGFCLVAWCALCFQRSLPNLIKLPLLGLFLLLILVAAYFGRAALSARSYYLAPFAMFVLSYFPRRMKIWPLLLGALAFFPILTLLGNTRQMAVSQVGTEVRTLFVQNLSGTPAGFVLAPYASKGGDFTCVDVFASALSNTIRFRPYGLSYLYPFVHFIPRQWWPNKPVDGVLTDRDAYMTFYNMSTSTQQVPYTAGVVGELYVEGGFSFIPLGGLIMGIVAACIDNGLVFTQTQIRSRTRLYALFAFLVFLAFFASRMLPYQLFVYICFIGSGMWFGALLFPDMSEPKPNELMVGEWAEAR